MTSAGREGRRPSRAPRKERTAGAREGRGSPPRREPPERRGGGWRWIAALLLLAAVVLLALHPWKPRVPPDPLAGMDLDAAADSADALDRRGKFVESLVYVDYLERVGRLTPEFEARAATASNNATIEVREKDGLVIPATRSSVERVALIGQSIRRSHEAEEMDGTTPMRMAYVVARAGQLAVWGFVREAYVEYRRAASLGPLPERALAEARWVEAHLGDPTRGLGVISPVEREPGVAGSTLVPSSGSLPRPQGRPRSPR